VEASIFLGHPEKLKKKEKKKKKETLKNIEKRAIIIVKFQTIR
jgi:hypothetical protein